MGRATERLLADLEGIKARFGRPAALKKARILDELARRPIEEAGEFACYHDALCFLRAFPDDREVHRRAEAELRRFAGRVARCLRAHGNEWPDVLLDSGIAGTPMRYPYGYPMACWLVDRFGDAVDLDWDEYEQGEADRLGPVATLVAGWPETAALDDESISVREWFEAARGERRVGFLRWLIERLRASGIPRDAQQVLYDSMELPIVWDLADCWASRTRARIPISRIFTHEDPLRGRTADLRLAIREPLARSRPARARRGRGWIDHARAALAVRSRELFPIAHATEREVYEVEVGRGVRFVLLGMVPERRLPIETDYGAFIVKNGIPIGYGVGALLCERMEIAVNVFPAFRQGESSYLFEQFCRLFHHQFGSRVFLVERYQLGHENDEGLDAGSFWFYHKLGFRPVDPRVAILAEKEAERLSGGRGRRSDRRMLRRLARGHVQLELADGDSPAGTIDLTRIGLAVSRSIEERFGGDRERAERESSARVGRSLGIDLSGWTREERTAFRKLAPLIALLPGIERWSAAEKGAFARALRAKGSAREARYAREMAVHAPARAALVRLSAG